MGMELIYPLMLGYGRRCLALDGVGYMPISVEAGRTAFVRTLLHCLVHLDVHCYSFYEHHYQSLIWLNIEHGTLTLNIDIER
jgi:hypothetical protein